MRIKYVFFILVLTVGFNSLLYITNVNAGEKYSVQGTFVEGCDCSISCPCELTGIEMGCQTVGAMSLSDGSYLDTDLAGVKVAFATTPGKWVRIYIDANNGKQKYAATQFMKGIYGAFGKIEAVTNAKIDISDKGGRYSVKVNDGQIMQLTTEPILGGDNKTPLMHSNTSNKLNSVFMQGKTISANYSDNGRKFELSGTNSYFNPQMNSEGSIE